MESEASNLLIAAIVFFALGAASVFHTFKLRRSILENANQKLNDASVKKEEIISAAKSEKAKLIDEARASVIPYEQRIERLQDADKEIVARLKATRERIDNLADICSERAASIEMIAEEDLLSSPEYQEDRKKVRAELKKLACNAIENMRDGNANVGIGKYVTIAAKADLAGALLMTTVEMLSAKTTHSNGHASLEKLFETITVTQGLVSAMESRATISPRFIELLEKRLQIEIDYKRARQVAKEVQRELREKEQEERKARREAERAEQEAAKEEEIKKQAIADIEAKMNAQDAENRAEFEAQLSRLQKELAEAHEKFERARSRAQDTKQGHVYIISNIGSFGNDILKIGMTRRLNPLDRVKELGDASVPFSFDIHALIESEDAPELENKLHQILDHHRVNKVNRRKEYFKVTIDDIETELHQLGINALISKVPSADEYYQSIKLTGEA